MGNTDHVDFDNKNLDNGSFNKITSYLADGEHLGANYYVDEDFSNNVQDLSLWRLDPDEKEKPERQFAKSFNSTLTSPRTILDLHTKTKVNSLSENHRNRRFLSTVINGQEKDFHNRNLTKFDSGTVNRNPLVHEKVSSKKSWWWIG